MKKTLILLSAVGFAAVLLAGCAEVYLNGQGNEAQTSSTLPQTAEFYGEKGIFVPLDENGVVIEAASVDDGKAHFFNTALPNGKPVYFFIVKSPDGKLRAAANGCQICGRALQGFRQEGDYMVCNTCGNKYPLDKIATEKGGCNPAPINPDLRIDNGNVGISVEELNGITWFF